MRRSSYIWLWLVFLPASVFAETLIGEGPRLGSDRITQEEIAGGRLTLREIRRAGLKIFATPFNILDGFGDGPFDPSETDTRSLAGGGRPTLQGNGTFLRVNGLDAQTCVECHNIVSNATVPPVFGVGGVAGINSSPMFQPDLMNIGDLVDGAADGIAEFNGRLINPPFLFGAGGVELVAKDMTRRLQSLRAHALANPGLLVTLEAKGVHFGTIVVDALGNVDTTHIEGVDDDLVVRPFGRKGEFTLRAFDVDALMFHMGMQSVEAVGIDVDADRDGVANEILVGELSALSIFLATMDRPVERVVSRQAKHGFQRFHEIGCAACHRPEIVTESRVLSFSFPEVPQDPGANVYFAADLTKAPAQFRAHRDGGVIVPMFSDLKRHDMGPRLAETFNLASDQRNREFITARLWGVADTAPYLHDGRALTLVEAILLHGGEAQQARDGFAALPEEHKNEILSFLQSLRTPKNPNVDVVGQNDRR